MNLTTVEVDEAAYDRALGRAVAAVLKLNGTKHKEVAAAINMDATLLSARLNGRTPFKASELLRIAMSVGVKEEDFYAHMPRGDVSPRRRYLGDDLLERVA